MCRTCDVEKVTMTFFNILLECALNYLTPNRGE